MSQAVASQGGSRRQRRLRRRIRQWGRWLRDRGGLALSERPEPCTARAKCNGQRRSDRQQPDPCREGPETLPLDPVSFHVFSLRRPPGPAGPRFYERPSARDRERSGPLALALAKSEDFDRGGLPPGDVGFGFSPRRHAPRMAGHSRKPRPRNPPPLLRCERNTGRARTPLRRANQTRRSRRRDRALNSPRRASCCPEKPLPSLGLRRRFSSRHPLAATSDMPHD